MKRSLLLVSLLVPLATAYAADHTERTYADPTCSSRTADPNDCVVPDGSPRVAIVPGKQLPGESSQPAPVSGSSLTASKDRPLPQPTPQAGTSFSAPKKK
jgi:hypothetical protein